MKLLMFENNLSLPPAIIKRVKYSNPANLTINRPRLRFSQNKLACKGLGIALSAFIVLILLAIVFKAELPMISAWLAFFTVVFFLVLLNLVYLKLIDNLFKKLNNRQKQQ